MPGIVSILAAMVVCTALGVVIERLAYKPLRSAPSLAVLITAIGVSYFLQNTALLIWGSAPKYFTSIVKFESIKLFDSQLVITSEAVVTIAACIVIRILGAAGLLSSSFSGLLVPICAYVVMAVFLNLTVGILGELSLGHAGFMSIGAFSGVVAAAMMETGVGSPVLRLVLAMIVGGIIAGIAGFVIGIPVLRLRGDYLAIVTLAFGEIIKNIINCIYVGLDSSGLHFAMAGLGDVQGAESLGLQGGRVILNGPVGAVGVQKLSTFTIGFILVSMT